jgi:ABC-2 type transport system permease protein
MRQIFKNFQKYRFLLSELVVKEIKLKYRKSYLGILWTLIEPLLTMIVLYLVFSKLRKNNDRSFAVYILTGRLLYSYFSHATKSAMKSIRVNSQMIKKVYVPKYIYPLSSILSQFITFLISLLVLAAVSIVLQIKPTIYLLESIIPILILFVMVLGVGLILATMAVFFRDMEYLWDVILMLIMYCSAIFYYPSMVGSHSWILKINPLYAVISNFRNTILEGVPLEPGAFLYSATFSVITLIVGIWLFYKNQDKFILHI